MTRGERFIVARRESRAGPGAGRKLNITWISTLDRFVGFAKRVPGPAVRVRPWEKLAAVSAMIFNQGIAPSPCLTRLLGEVKMKKVVDPV
jgi:hypothetical protein